MIINHLSENEIQQYVSEPLLCDESIAAHVVSCRSCNEQVKAYQLLYSGIQQQSKPAFDFDLSNLVLSQLDPAKPKFYWEISVAYLFAVLGAVVILVSGIWFSKYLSVSFTGSSTLFLYLFAAITLVTLLFQGFEIFRRYQKQMNALNIS